VKSIPLSKFISQIEELYAAPMRSTSTRTAMVRVLRQVEQLGVRTTADLTPGLVAKFITARSSEVSPRTVHGELLRIQAACNLAESLDALKTNPFRVRKMRDWIRPGRPEVKPHHTREQISGVLWLMTRDVEERQGWVQWRARRLLALTTLFAYTGLRRNEGLFAQVEDLDLDARVFWVRERSVRLKTTASEQPVPLPASAIEPMRDWLSHRLDRPPGFEIPECPWLFPNTRGAGAWHSGEHGDRPCERLQAVAKRAGVEGMTFQSLRRSLASHLEAHGLGQALITRCLRHTSERTTKQWYQSSDVPNLCHAVESFEY
jgi:integrase